MTSLQSAVMAGLNTDKHTVVTTGFFKLDAQSTVVQPSGLVITLSQSGSQSVSFVSAPMSAQALTIGVQGSFYAVAGDIIQVAVTSSAVIDQSPDLVKTIINLRRIF